MPDSTVTMTGFEALQAKLKRLDNIGATVKPALVRAASLVRSTVSKYPPASEANAEKEHGRWYERGYGTKYRRRDGTVTGRKTSQMLNRSWSTNYTFTPTSAQAIIGNRASYSPYVHDRDRQPEFHARRKWKTAQGVLEQLGPRIIADIGAAIDAELK